MVGDNNIISSNSARNLGVIFDKSIKRLQKIQNRLQECWLVYLDFHILRLHCLTCTGYQLGTESRLKFVL